MVDKPRRRKRQGHRRAYLSLAATAVALIIAGGWYVYAGGTIPFINGSSSSSTSTVNIVYARIDTSLGSFEAELYSASAPQTVSNFVQLAQSGFYSNLVWHRIVEGFVIQTGDPNTKDAGGNRTLWGQGTSGTNIPFESDPSLHNYQYYLGMASTGAGVGGSSQFYINLADNAALDGNYAVFGKVISGTSVVDSIGNVPVYTSGAWADQPITPVYVTSVTILQSP